MGFKKRMIRPTDPDPLRQRPETLTARAEAELHAHRHLLGHPFQPTTRTPTDPQLYPWQLDENRRGPRYEPPKPKRGKPIA